LSLRVSPFAFFEAAFYVNLEKIVAGKVFFDILPVLAVRGYERGQHENAGIREKPGNFRNSPEVLLPVLGAEPEVRVQSVSYVIAIKHVRPDTPVEQDLLDPMRDR
jgi:hypothetical protein